MNWKWKVAWRKSLWKTNCRFIYRTILSADCCTERYGTTVFWCFFHAHCKGSI